MTNNYIKAHTFEDFCTNQEELIKILNHRMTNMETNMATIKNDVSWTKKILWGIFGVLSLSFLTIVLQAAFGGL